MNSYDEFLDNWGNFTAGQLEGLDWTNLFVAGGSVLGKENSQKILKKLFLSRSTPIYKISSTQNISFENYQKKILAGKFY